jgi:heme oxygenase (mycobilin-producing)
MRHSVLAIALLGGLAATSATRAQPAPVVLINVFETSAATLDEAVRYWEASRDFLARQPGYVSTRLHQAITPDTRFQLINVAVWESAEAFAAAIARMRQEMRLPPPAGLQSFPGLYRVIRE